MLEISHQQAQYLIRQSLDARSGDGRRLPEEQWAALQAHLEGCEACRAYRGRAEAQEKHLRRTLVERWHSIDGPVSGLASALVMIRRARQNRAQQITRGVVRALALLLVALAVFLLPRLGREDRRDPLPAAQIQPTATATPEPTLAPGDRFDGAVLYEARAPGSPDGQTDIFLLRTGPEDVEISNMTANPANDTHPIWSPDGEWIAFFSDRALEEGQPGKTELWVMTIAGTRLTQITSAPEIAWEGPPAWSPDGTWIAVVGRRIEQGDTPWVYLVSLTGEGEGEPVVVPGTRGVTGPLQFAPDTVAGGISLFYRSPDLAVIRRFQLFTGLTEPVTDAVPGYTVGRAFDVRPVSDYMEMLYTLVEQDGISLWRMIENPQRSRQTYILDNLPHGAASGLSFLPQSPRAAFLGRPSEDGCRVISLWRTDPEPFLQVNLDACVQGELDAQHFQREQYFVDGSWAILRAKDRETGEEELLALHVPYETSFGIPPMFYPLAEVSGISGPPRVRPTGQERLDIAPRSARPPTAALPTVERPPSLQGEVLLAVQSAESSSIIAMKPDGSNIRTILPAEAGDPAWEGALYQCPTVSPDSKQIAYLSDKSAEPLDLPELYVMDVNTGQIYQRAMPHLLHAAYDCPVWSPDGGALAVVARSFGIGYLAVFSAGESDPVYLTINMTSIKTLPSWSPDGSRIYLANPRRMGFSSEVAAFEWRGEEASLTAVDWTLKLDGWEDIQAMSFSADSIALIVVRYQPMQAELRVYHVDDQSLLYRKPIGGYDPRGLYGPGRIAWMQGNQVVFAQYGAPLERYKAQLWRYDPSDDTVQRLVATEDVLYDWAIQGGWLVVSTESGLWGDSVAGRFDDPSAPVWLADFFATSLDWR